MRAPNFCRLYAAFLLLACVPVPSFAQKNGNIFFSAHSMSGSTAKDKEHTHLKGNAKIQTDTIELKADSIELSGSDYRIIRAQGSVEGTYTEGGFTFKCNSLSYDRETEITVLEGSVFMYDTENDVKAKAEYIEYNQNTETALIQINVEITREDAVCTSAFALYRKKTQMLELNGAPKVTEKNNVFRAQEITFNLDTKEITLDGKVSGSVTDKREQSNSGKSEKNAHE